MILLRLSQAKSPIKLYSIVNEHSDLEMLYASRYRTRNPAQETMTVLLYDPAWQCACRGGSGYWEITPR